MPTAAKAKKADKRVINQGYELVSISKLKPHPRNPRQGDVGAIFQSIDRNGFYGAVIAQKSTKYVLAGNHRLKAAEEAGISSLPVIWLDVDDERAMRILLADNRTNDLASYDNPALAQMLSEIQAEHGTLDGTGYDGDALDELLADLADQSLGASTGGESSEEATVLHYDIVFNSAEEQKVWFGFLQALREEYPEYTIAERIVRYIEAHGPDGN